ncbi:MAG: glycosyltransferase [Rhodoferax sp.]|nr:glycosyltransferase [Rhodoferax sp.]
MDYYPNQECMARFCEQTWPLLAKERRRHEAFDCWRRPHAWDARTGRSARRHGDGPGARCCPFIRSSALMVAPLAIARGTQNKILEAMAMGVPVVTSTIAAGGVDAEPGTHFSWPTRRRPENADAIMRLLRARPSARAWPKPGASACSATTPGPIR